MKTSSSTAFLLLIKQNMCVESSFHVSFHRIMLVGKNVETSQIYLLSCGHTVIQKL